MCIWDKIGWKFSWHQFIIDICQFSSIDKYKSSKEGGNICFIKQGLVVKILQNLELMIIENICLELPISNKKWFLLFSRKFQDSKWLFFHERSKYLSQIGSKDNGWTAGYMNWNLLHGNADTSSHFSEFGIALILQVQLSDPHVIKI